MIYNSFNSGPSVIPALRAVLAAGGLGFACLSQAALKDDIGFTDLHNELGAALPLGSASVFQIEAESPQNSNQWIADVSDSQFTGKTITDLSLTATPSSGISGHATSVGRLFYGNSSSMSPGISDIGAHGVEGWLFDQIFPNSSYATPIVTNRRIANHSWVGEGFEDASGNLIIDLTSSSLQRNDWMTDVDELIQVYGANNGSVDRVWMATAYNGIVAGVSDATHADGVMALDATYPAGRAAIHLVTPVSATSSSAPIIASAAALLIDAAALNPDWSDDATSNRSGSVIYNAERAETIKAALMAGASRLTVNSTSIGDIRDYRQDSADQTDNGLDWRYGAGQLNVYNSYQILAAGEFNTVEDGANNIGFAGFDHNPSFGGAMGTDTVATYDLGINNEQIDLAISLVWNLRNFTTAGATTFNENSVLYNLDLELVNITDGNVAVAQSSSAIDNTENIWYSLEPGKHYQIRVLRGAGQSNFNWDYSIAWFNSPTLPVASIPLPSWIVVLLLSTLLVVYKKSQRH